MYRRSDEKEMSKQKGNGSERKKKKDIAKTEFGRRGKEEG